MTEPAANGRYEPDERHGPDRAGVWGAATDPVGSRPASESPASDAPAPVAPAPVPPAPDAPAAGGVVGREVSREAVRPASRPDRSRRPQSRRPGAPGGDLLTDMQRWLIRSSAKTMRREIEGQVRRTLGSGRSEPEDVWGKATTEPPPDFGESPECAWCPICRAARRMRDSGPGLTSQISGVSDAVAAAVQDAIGAFDGVLSRTTAAPERERPADRSPASGHADSASDTAERAADEPGDRG
jgi:hypothetical protein